MPTHMSVLLLLTTLKRLHEGHGKLNAAAVDRARAVIHYGSAIALLCIMACNLAHLSNGKPSSSVSVAAAILRSCSSTSMRT